MSGADEIVNMVKQAGGRIERAGDKLRVVLPTDCSSELKTMIRDHKNELLAFLKDEHRNGQVNSDPWIHIAQQILAGEFDEADRSTRESLMIGLRRISHPLCRLAMSRLRPI